MIASASKPEKKKPEEKEKMEETTEEKKTIPPKLNRLASEHVFDDPFFSDNTDEVVAEKKKKNWEKENFEKLLMISLGSVACGTTVFLFLCLQTRKRQNKAKPGEEFDEATGTNQERKINLHVYDKVGPRALPEDQDVPLDDVPFIDEVIEQPSPPTPVTEINPSSEISMSKIREGFIRKGVKEIVVKIWMVVKK
jgi:hypothetical protein